MNIADILKKTAEGKPLTEGERAFAGNWQPPDTAALEKQIEALRGSRQTETERLAADVDRLTRQFNEAQRKASAAEARAAAMQRQSAIGALRQAHGIQFIGGVSPALLENAFERAFEGIEDLTDPAKTAEAVNTFRLANAALILDTSGSGAGSLPKSTHAPGSKPATTGGVDDVARILAEANVIKTNPSK